MPRRSLVPTLLLLVPAALAGLLFAGCETDMGGPQVEVTETVTRGVTPRARTLVLDGYNGSITLTDTSAQEASLTFTQHARASSREDARALLRDIQIEEQGGEEEYAYRLRSGTSGRTSVDVRGRVPKNVRLRIVLQNGNVALSGLGGRLHVENENGNVRIGGAASATDARTRNGSVEVGLRRMPQQEDGEVRLRTANGNVALTLPGTSSAAVEARTSAGQINIEGLTFQKRNMDRQSAGARFQGQLGQGRAAVDLRTENGSITLREGTVRRLQGVSGGGPRPAPGDTTAPDTAMRQPTDTTTAPPLRQDRVGQDSGGTARDTGVQPPMAPPRDTAHTPAPLRRRDTTGAVR